MVSTLEIIAMIFAVWLVVLGVALAFNNKGTCQVIGDFADETALVWSWGLWVLAFGVLILAWTGYVITWAGYAWVMPLLGWAAIIKGVWLMWWPKMGTKMMKTYCKAGGLTMFAGIVAILLGIFFWQTIVPMY
ncbi:MAG: hypothetical protein VE98_C0001G0349 [candidate division Kazan bacterium GW2011_GWA1_50_15]|uniref:Uncharacterized protein n=2 Tax=Bacteria division Kazan-3B-28 TaxID=1798534 RepID=A0A0G2A3D5_UNCK3|nr:MAG: hypothetical protein VE98_C0001G0349 [candidate division Kazan bacterium GW2011_GWA1_50_15]KKW25377.1 MAG: hypothetical protein VE99_C0001G0014 [candidate division Kazan bacterium GW2011_GWC1_52_13]KKW26684.1 MAG: hypothetical protein VF00_C0002G0009 [candidate division Kazan bacterium GW2011_GWB1_52_7]HAV65893.1 hypothetical protein [Patescibacteria group bacterium]HCR42861.1 hypothetical protein [Patescibacteria group bacterium]